MADNNILTPKEMEVLYLIYRGKTNPQIAEELHISLSTVKTHIQHMLEKSETSRRVPLIYWALQEGIITPES